VRALVIDKVIRAPANGDTENEYCRLLNDLFPLLNSNNGEKNVHIFSEMLDCVLGF